MNPTSLNSATTNNAMTLYPACTPENVWVAQEARTGWWIADEWPSGPALLMYFCPAQLAQELQRRLRVSGKPDLLWTEWYTVRCLGWQDACQLAATVGDPSDRPAVSVLLAPGPGFPAPRSGFLTPPHDPNTRSDRP